MRVLHHEADLREFTIGADALVTQWDGKNDNGEDLPTGKYHARGYLVGPLQAEDLGQATTAPPESNSSASVKVKLMPNPLANDTRALVGLTTGFDNNGSYLKTNDGLPLFTISKSPNSSRVSGMGTRGFTGQNPEPGPHISYLINAVPANARLSLTILDASGTAVRELPVNRREECVAGSGIECRAIDALSDWQRRHNGAGADVGDGGDAAATATEQPRVRDIDRHRHWLLARCGGPTPRHGGFGGVTPEALTKNTC